MGAVAAHGSAAEQQRAAILRQRRGGLQREQRGGAMVSVSFRRGQQREDGVVALAVQQAGEEGEDGAVVPIVGGRRCGIGREAGIALIEEVVAPDAEHFAGGQGLALAYGGQAAAALALAGEPDAVHRFGQRRVAIAGLAVGDDHVIRGPAEFPSQAVGGGGEGVLVVRVGGHNQQFGTRGLGGERPCQQGLGHRQQEGLARHWASPPAARSMISRAISRIGVRRCRLVRRRCR